ncbi:hypothetical protein CTA2_7718 [Colletotrichum tanaceti]|uniref:Mid2 domain-containing protein n=1 Tax=Colletotrichum tanaceti TaxID=1306861 RepID=A0A4U6XKR6_9PEZI|nr:hypothetical protein CTA2_7718 [Colletotrichum tanaceti]TKW56167.1 hypothetical protein CTA1_2964 [Colletotrichum tanaceti]
MLFSRRLSPTSAILLLSNVLNVAEAGAFPRQTQEHIAFRTLDVRSWPLATPAPWLGMMRRQDDSSTNTVCGYIGADPNLPATCSAGSHCAMDASASAVGCCPNGAACTTGVYTSCVDNNSPTQTVSDPYIFTCQGSNVCYRNAYEGGAYQYGCGTASQGASVFATATGLSTTVAITRISGLVTLEATSSSTSSSSSSSSPTSSSTSSTTSSTSSTTTSRSSTSTTTKSSATTTRSQPPTSSAAAPPPGAAEAALRHHGSVIGGAIAGAAIFVAIVSVALWMLKRKRGNQRRGPGLGKGTSYIPQTNPKDFNPVPGGQVMFDQAGYGHPDMMPGAHGTTTSISGGRSATTPQSPTPGGYNPASGAFASGVSRSPYEDTPLAHQSEMEEFSRGYNDAINPAGHDDHRAVSSGGNSSLNPYGAGAGASSGQQSDVADERPLWQQDRRQSRNMMWM